MQCLKNSKCGRGTWKQNGGKQLDLLTEKATKALDGECTGLIFSFFSRAPSNTQVYAHIVFCVGGSNAPPVLYWPYRTLFRVT